MLEVECTPLPKAITFWYSSNDLFLGAKILMGTILLGVGTTGKATETDLGLTKAGC